MAKSRSVYRDPPLPFWWVAIRITTTGRLYSIYFLIYKPMTATTPVKFGKDFAPSIEVPLKKVDGAVVTIKKRLPEYVLRQIHSEANKNDELIASKMLHRSIISWNLVDEEDQPIEITEETIQRLPSSDLVLLINTVTWQAAPSTEEVEKNA